MTETQVPDMQFFNRCSSSACPLEDGLQLLKIQTAASLWKRTPFAQSINCGSHKQMDRGHSRSVPPPPQHMNRSLGISYEVLQSLL